MKPICHVWDWWNWLGLANSIVYWARKTLGNLATLNTSQAIHWFRRYFWNVIWDAGTENIWRDLQSSKVTCTSDLLIFFQVFYTVNLIRYALRNAWLQNFGIHPALFMFCINFEWGSNKRKEESWLKVSQLTSQIGVTVWPPKACCNHRSLLKRGLMKNVIYNTKQNLHKMLMRTSVSQLCIVELNLWLQGM